jgi:membrane protein YdbS with pleckstrin-like domain
MFCDRCGAENSETAKFCRKCGEAFEGEIETRVAVRGERPADPQPVPTNVNPDQPRGEEAEIFSISPTLLFVKAGYVAAAIAALLLVAITSAFLSQYVSVWLSIFIGLLLFLIPAYYHVRQKLVRYTLTDSKLEIDTGFISRTTRNVPIRRIQDVTVASTMPQRVLGFGNLVVDNASEEGGKVILKNIDKPKFYADVLLKQMRHLDS